MRKALFHKVLKIELLVIIALLTAILVVSVLNDLRRRKLEEPAPVTQPTGRSPEREVFLEDGRYTEFGLASYYGNEFQGTSTANGEIYDRNALTAAHRELPFDSQARVTNMESGNQVVVRINDRGPRDEGRILDVSEQAAQKLGILDAGVTRIRLEVLE